MREEVGKNTQMDYTEKMPNVLDNRDGVIIHPQSPAFWTVKSRNIIMNNASGDDGIQLSYFQILR